MGKWTHLKGHLPDVPDPQTPYFAELRTLTDTYAKLTKDEIAEVYEQRQAESDGLNEQRKRAEMHVEAAGRALMRLMEQEKLESVVLRGHRWTPSPEPYPSVVDKVALREWATRSGLADLLSINPQTLKSTVKTALEANGEGMPEGIELYLKTGFSRRKVSA